ncbi:uncharacterized protein ARMOST_13947 [Armillaria ostoyae]|uniref:Uncharacterized protein n=1 Tax=Armillaria ostoyae TaxID=47428 RepID=A0A284RP75_ARMOS|nr:uncharacterized protein ARMOST_13947 [Armillaria ostoyae]
MFLPTSLATAASESTTVQVVGRTQHNAAASLTPQSPPPSLPPYLSLNRWNFLLALQTVFLLPAKVLLKQVDAKGIVFYINYTSQKIRAKMILGVGVHLLGVYNARERSLLEWDSIIRNAGLQITSVCPLRAKLSVIECDVKR